MHDPGLQADRFLWARRAYRLKPEPDIRSTSLPAAAERFMMIVGSAERQ
jgi:hypothetical protein